MQASRDRFYWAIPCAILPALTASFAAILLGDRRDRLAIVLVVLGPVVPGCKL